MMICDESNRYRLLVVLGCGLVRGVERRRERSEGREGGSEGGRGRDIRPCLYTKSGGAAKCTISKPGSTLSTGHICHDCHAMPCHATCTLYFTIWLAQPNFSFPMICSIFPSIPLLPALRSPDSFCFAFHDRPVHLGLGISASFPTLGLTHNYDFGDCPVACQVPCCLPMSGVFIMCCCP